MANQANIGIAKTYLRRMHTAMKRSYPFEQFLAGLKLNSYNEAISDADFDDWLDSLGFIVSESQKGFFSHPHEDLIEDMAGGAYASNPAWVPTRKTIDSYWLSYDFKPSYYDIAKVAVVQSTKVVTATGNVIGTVGNVLNETGQAAANTMKTFKYIAYVAGPAIILYILWANKDKMADKVARVTGGAVDKVTRGVNKLVDKSGEEISKKLKRS